MVTKILIWFLGCILQNSSHVFNITMTNLSFSFPALWFFSEAFMADVISSVMYLVKVFFTKAMNDTLVEWPEPQNDAPWPEFYGHIG